MHVQTVTSSYTGSRDVCDIKVLHNEERPAWVVIRAMGRIYAAIRAGRPVVREDSNRRGLSIAKFNSQKFLSVVTPSGLDVKMRKSMRIVPFQKPHRKS
jgi:hypothetical protein